MKIYKSSLNKVSNIHVLTINFPYNYKKSAGLFSNKTRTLHRDIISPMTIFTER